MNLAERMARTLDGLESFLPVPLSGLVISHSISQAVSLLVRSPGSHLAAGNPWRTTFKARRVVGRGSGSLLSLFFVPWAAALDARNAVPIIDSHMPYIAGRMVHSP